MKAKRGVRTTPTTRTAGTARIARPALYAQVKEHITRRIQSGEWTAGHRLPSEHELVAQFRISRMTANRALSELSTQGRIVRVAGVGSFVAEDKPQSTLLQIANIASEIRGRGHEYGFRLLACARVPAPAEVAAWLDLDSGTPVFHCLCLHLENGVPVQLEDRYVNARLVPAFLDQDFSEIPPSEYLVRHVPFDQIEHLVDAVLPSGDEATRLAMDAHEPCLLLTRRTWMEDVPITVVRCLHPASRYRLGSRLRTDAHTARSPAP